MLPTAPPFENIIFGKSTSKAARHRANCRDLFKKTVYHEPREIREQLPAEVFAIVYFVWFAVDSGRPAWLNFGQLYIMNTEQIRPSACSNRTIENWFLLIAGLLAHAPLYYQLPRWANGLDPTFVHPRWTAESNFPIVLHMSAIHPVVWIAVVALSFIRLCQNFGWKLER